MRLLIGLLLISLLCSIALASLIYRGHNPKHIALTFDDGPVLGVTDQVLKILKSENISATFFVVGNKVAKQPELLRKVFKAGHEIGNHTYNHSKLTWINNTKIPIELNKTSALIRSITGQKVNLFRPPHGTLTKPKRKLIEQLGYDIVLWSINADDFWHTNGGMRSANSLVKRVVSRVRGGDIVLMHDNSQQMIEALPRIIKVLKKKGYSFVTVSQLKKGKS